MKSETKEIHSDLDEMSIIDHLDELRKRILICVFFISVTSILSYMVSDVIMALMKEPLGNIDLVFLTPVEGFMTKIKVAVFGGLVLSSPVIFLQTLLFIMPAMYTREKVASYIALPLIVGLFLSGIYFCFRFILPTTLTYLMSFGSEELKPMLSVGKYFSFVIVLTVSIGAVFEMPILMLLLTKLGVVNYETLSRKRKYALLVIVTITAIITPTPDAVTLLAVSIPLVLLFELSLGVMYLNHKVFARKGS